METPLWQLPWQLGHAVEQFNDALLQLHLPESHSFLHRQNMYSHFAQFTISIKDIHICGSHKSPNGKIIILALKKTARKYSNENTGTEKNGRHTKKKQSYLTYILFI